MGKKYKIDCSKPRINVKHYMEYIGSILVVKRDGTLKIIDKNMTYAEKLSLKNEKKKNFGS